MKNSCKFLLQSRHRFPHLELSIGKFQQGLVTESKFPAFGYTQPKLAWLNRSLGVYVIQQVAVVCLYRREKSLVSDASSTCGSSNVGSAVDKENITSRYPSAIIPNRDRISTG